MVLLRHPLIVLICCLLGALTAAEPISAKEAEEPSNKTTIQIEQDDYYKLLDVFVDTLDHIERNYVREISRRELLEAAIDGMVEKLDMHSSYISPDDVEVFRSSVDSQFGGIGIHVAIQGGKIVVVSPLAGTPAHRAGLLAGDHIIAIKGKPTKGFALDDAVRQLKGKVGTDVEVTVQHNGRGQARTVTMTRQMIRIETVLGNHRKHDNTWEFFHDKRRGIGYIRLNSFSRDTAKELRKAMDELNENDFQALVLDLRFNPGGLLSAAIEVSDLFVRKGRIVSTSGRNTKERVWNAKTSGTYDGFPMAILINRFSASASEIVSACLQDHDRATIIGERSFGKGSVQNVIPLEHGKSVLKLTTASYLRPNGHNIHRFPDYKESDEWGVKPDDDYAIQFTDDEMKGLIRHQRDAHMLHRAEAEDSDSESESETSSDLPRDDLPMDGPFVDRQLLRALDYLSGELARAGMSQPAT